MAIALCRADYFFNITNDYTAIPRQVVGGVMEGFLYNIPANFHKIAIFPESNRVLKYSEAGFFFVTAFQFSKDILLVIGDSDINDVTLRKIQEHELNFLQELGKGQPSI